MIPNNSLPTNGSMSNGYLPYGYPPNVYPPSMYPPNNYPQSMYPQNDYPQNGYAQSPYQSTSYKPMSSYTSMVERSTTRFSEKEKEEFSSKLNGTTMSKLMIEEEPLSKIVPREKEEKEMKEKKEKVVKKKENKVKNENKEKKAKKEKKVAVEKTRATLHDNDYMKSFEATSLPVNFKALYTKTAMLKSAHISFSMPRMKLEPVLEDKKLEHEDWRVQVLEVIVNEETMKYFIPYTFTEFNELYDCYVYWREDALESQGEIYVNLTIFRSSISDYIDDTYMNYDMDRQIHFSNRIDYLDAIMKNAIEISKEEFIDGVIKKIEESKSNFVEYFKKK